jgi:hypothetical protein
MDMDEVIEEALDFASCYLKWKSGEVEKCPVFSNDIT